MTDIVRTAVQLPPAGQYRVDPERSQITFRTRHMFGLGRVTGSFALRDGGITVAEPVDRSTAHAEIAADSFDTGNGTRDNVIRSAKYLDTANHPVIRFDSAEVTESDGSWALAGDLTVRATKRAVRLAIEHCAVATGALTLRATTRVDRTEFDITAQPGMTGRYLDLVLDLVAAERCQS